MRCETCCYEIPEGMIGCPNCSDHVKAEQVVKEVKEEIARSKSIMQGMLQRFNFLDERLSTIQHKMKEQKQALRGVHQQPANHAQQKEGEFDQAKFKREHVSKDNERLINRAQEEPQTEPRRARIQITEILFGQKALLIAGLFVTLLGLGFFLKYAMEQNWGDPLTRIISVYILAGVFLAGGDRFRRKGYSAFGLCLIGGALAILYLATLGAYDLYHLFSVPMAFSFIVLTTLFAGFLALYYDNKWLAVLALIGGYICPVVLDILRYDNVNLLRYLTILNLGLLFIGLFKQWHLLYRLGFTLTWLLFSAWYLDHYTQRFFWPVLFYINVFFLIYSVIPYLYFFFREREESIQGIFTTLLNSFIAFGFNYALIQEYAGNREVSIITLSYSVFFAALAYLLRRKKAYHKQACYLLFANALFFLTLSGPLLFSKHWITLFFCAQVLSLLWVNKRYSMVLLENAAWLIMGIVFIKFYFYDYTVLFSFDIGNLRLLHDFVWIDYERWITGASVLCGLYVAMKTASLRRLQSPNRQGWMQLFNGLFCMGLFATLNIETAAFFKTYFPNAETAAISVLWMIISIALLILGLRKDSKNMRVTSLILMGATFFKIFTSDIKNTSTPFRIVSFLFVGFVLIGASYLYYRYKDLFLQKKENA